MIAGLHIGSNFRKFGHGKLPPLAMIAITLIPLLFGGLFVWSYYDPLGNLHKPPNPSTPTTPTRRNSTSPLMRPTGSFPPCWATR